MASNPYEVEHNIKVSTSAPHRRRPDMSSFTSHLHTISRDAGSTTTSTHHAGPTPVDAGALFAMVQEQMATLANSAPSDTNRDFLVTLIDALRSDVDNPPNQIKGVTQEYLDSLERVPKKNLKDDSCPICAERYMDDKYPLVVELPCHGAHKFDLECVGPWLQSKGTCPLCRKDLTAKKEISVPVDDDEEDDMDGLYG
ncbi:putative RING-type domain-containing protein [Seiridium unicorne]|uniref:RING-type domain-containing protein n=1 Tax=Seiridium unicorne TaxID=138068 RepID=A0ABR2VB56_9PEZI